MLQFPQVLPWEGYAKLCEEYGDMIYLKAPGQGILVLGSKQRTVDLLDKRAANYSDRPAFPITELMDFTWTFGLMPYGLRWRQHRRAFHQYLNNNAVKIYHPIMHEETKSFLRKVKSQPDDIFEHVQFLFGTEIMRVAYGFDDIRRNEELIHNAEALIVGFADAVVPGRYLVNIFPSLKHVPSWFPGAGFKRFLGSLASRHATQANGKKGSHPSMAADLIDRLPEDSDLSRAEVESIARNVCGIAYVAGAETTVNLALALLYVLASYPDIQSKGQTEIDSVVGLDRLPAVTDIQDLPYVHAIVKEVGRWFTVVPLGVPHSNSEDDEYDGFFIPKGTIIFQNNWTMMHNPDVFDKPFEFIPERYLKDDQIDPSVPDAEAAAFGHGRRNDALFLMAASLLATYTLTAGKDEAGGTVPLKLQSQNPSVSKPAPFECQITLRPGRERLLLE
ncbi:hypothetical protein EST38_g11359 [Candolleomyces aberdarensis]|uniref:O-methylsterigmatocystin oxidoreductase n=1 Tax=Candolleomyces aberdarensis TaxID=2316362 RepID=A0A4Q2D8B8_9AGAR|nr:hypothetical protein EST38_g11359 [Candolleomyces aberdarensis]